MTELERLMEKVEDASSVAVSAHYVAHATYYAAPYAARAADATDALKKAELELFKYLEEQDND